MKVIATKEGYDGIKIRQPGDEFEMPDGAKGSWFKAVGKPAAPEPTKGTGRAKTVSELAAQQAEHLA